MPLLLIARTCDNHFVRIRVHVVDLMPSRPAVPAYGLYIREGFAARRAPECIGMLRALVGLETAVRTSHPSANRAVQTNAPGLGGNRHYKRHSTSMQKLYDMRQKTMKALMMMLIAIMIGC